MSVGPALNWDRLLPLNTMHCPKEGTALHWEVFGGMRVRREAGAGHIYRALCPKCKRNFDVLTPKQND